VFGLCRLFGFQFAPRIKDLKDRKLYTIETPGTYLLLEPLVGGMIDPAAIIGRWPELMRVEASIEAGAVLPSVILRKLAAAGGLRQCPVARLADARPDRAHAVHAAMAVRPRLARAQPCRA
jgi:TnpA family transposase